MNFCKASAKTEIFPQNFAGFTNFTTFAPFMTSARIGEMNVQRSSCSLFVPSPRSLSKDSSKIKKGTTPVPPATVEWLVLSIPFEDTEEDLGIEIEPLKPNG